MKINFKNLIVLVLLPVLLVRRIFFWQIADKSNLPGKQFALFGFMKGKELLLKLKLSPKLLLNPVSIVRYFEFDFVNAHLNLDNGWKVLDISSPYLFGFFQSEKHFLEYSYINPDEKDLSNVISLSKKMRFSSAYLAQSMNVLKLTFPDNNFDAVISISVIEHIDNEGDSKAMKEIWRVLKPNGLFSFTVPVKKQFEMEYRDKDEYNLNNSNMESKYFFQRIYDNKKIDERLLSSISNYEIITRKIFGVNEKSFYFEYKRRWMKYNYWETVKDPYYISKHFSYYNQIDELEDIGVIGMTIKKLL